jgi:hypothetical protein
MLASLRYLDTFVKMDRSWLFVAHRLSVDCWRNAHYHDSDSFDGAR